MIEWIRYCFSQTVWLLPTLDQIVEFLELALPRPES
jgi:hypothetical protein